MDPRRFHRALIIYVGLGLGTVTAWQVWRFSDDKSLRDTAEANDRRVTEDFSKLREAAAAFETIHGHAATSWQDLTDSGYFPAPLTDPWSDRPYRFLNGAAGFSAFTYGRDDQEGGDGYDADRFSTGE